MDILTTKYHPKLPRLDDKNRLTQTKHPTHNITPNESKTQLLHQTENVDELDSLEDDKRLVAQLIQRNPKALNLWYERYSRPLLKRLYRLTGNEDQAEECLQNVFLEALRSLKKYRGDGPLGAWMNRIATYVTLNMFRKQKRWRSLWERILPEDLRAETQPSLPEQILMQKETRLALYDALEKLSTRKRMAILLCDIEGYSIEKAAFHLEVPIGTVASRLHHGRRELLLHMQDQLRQHQESIQEWIR